MAFPSTVGRRCRWHCRRIQVRQERNRFDHPWTDPGHPTRDLRGRIIVQGRRPSYTQRGRARGATEVRDRHDLSGSDDLAAPWYRVTDQIVEAIRAHEDVPKKVARRRAIEMLGEVGISDPARRGDDYPHEFSGECCSGR